MNAKLTDNDQLHHRHQQDQHQRHQQQQQHLQHAKKPDEEAASTAHTMVLQTGETELDITALPHKVGLTINYGERNESFTRSCLRVFFKDLENKLN